MGWWAPDERRRACVGQQLLQYSGTEQRKHIDVVSNPNDAHRKHDVTDYHQFKLEKKKTVQIKIFKKKTF